MSAKKIGKIKNQPGITTFVGTITEKVKKTKPEETGRKEQRRSANKTPLEPRKKRGTKEGVKATSTKTTGPKKRAKPENNSPDEECKQPSKKKTNTMSNPSQNKNSKEINGIVLNPEFQELKRQLFAGFKELIEPLKKNIQDLKNERAVNSETLNVETVNRKFEKVMRNTNDWRKS